MLESMVDDLLSNDDHEQESTYALVHEYAALNQRRDKLHGDLGRLVHDIARLLGIPPDTPWHEYPSVQLPLIHVFRFEAIKSEREKAERRQSYIAKRLRERNANQKTTWTLPNACFLGPKIWRTCEECTTVTSSGLPTVEGRTPGTRSILQGG